VSQSAHKGTIVIFLALSLFGPVGIGLGQNDSIKGETYYRLLSKQLGRDFDQAKLYLDSMQSLTGYQAIERGRLKTLLAEGKLLRRMKEPGKAVKVMTEAIGLARTSRNHRLQHLIYYEYGNVNLNLGDYPKATEAFLMARKYAATSKDTSGLAGSYNGLGIVQRRMKDLDGAFEYYSKALPLYRSINNTNGTSTVLLNLAIIEKQRNNFESALDLYAESLSHAEKIDPPDEGLFGYVYGNMSSLHNSMKNYQEAIDYGKKALEIRKKIGAKFEVANSYLGLAVNHVEIDQLSAARQYLQESENLTDSTNWSDLANIYNLKAKIEHKSANDHKAYTYLQKANIYRDSVYTLGNKKQIDELNAKFESELKEDNIARLELQDQLNTTKINQKNLMIYGLLASMLLVTLLGAQIHRRNKKIKAQNILISTALSEKETLLKEIHHRVKNNLQIISSLLGIQSRSVENPQAKEALEEGRSRVRSMSLIHQNLYSKNNLTGIEMDQYLNKLARDLLRNYKISTGSISLKTEAHDLKLDVETVIPIGLIVNELVTNALKYAFPDDRDGHILIDLDEKEDRLVLSVSDNGVGLDQARLEGSSDSFGQKLIQAFRSKLAAELDIDGSDGTSVTLTIKNYKKAI